MAPRPKKKTKEKEKEYVNGRKGYAGTRGLVELNLTATPYYGFYSTYLGTYLRNSPHLAFSWPTLAATAWSVRWRLWQTFLTLEKQVFTLDRPQINGKKLPGPH